MFQSVQSHGISIYGLVIVIIHNIMLCARFKWMQLLLVRAHITTSTKRFSTNIAMMILDACVRDHVLGQVTCRVEGLLAK